MFENLTAFMTKMADAIQPVYYRYAGTSLLLIAAIGGGIVGLRSIPIGMIVADVKSAFETPVVKVEKFQPSPTDLALNDLVLRVKALERQGDAYAQWLGDRDVTIQDITRRLGTLEKPTPQTTVKRPVAQVVPPVTVPKKPTVIADDFPKVQP